ncbi:hypothetical protein ACFLXD_03625 [Chloroflexota bacterium]
MRSGALQRLLCVIRWSLSEMYLPLLATRQERLGHATISTTLDLYSHVAPGLQEAAANKFDDILSIRDNNNSVLENI